MVACHSGALKWLTLNWNVDQGLGPRAGRRTLNADVEAKEGCCRLSLGQTGSPSGMQKTARQSDSPAWRARHPVGGFACWASNCQASMRGIWCLNCERVSDSPAGSSKRVCVWEAADLWLSGLINSLQKGIPGRPSCPKMQNHWAEPFPLRGTNSYTTPTQPSAFSGPMANSLQKVPLL